MKRLAGLPIVFILTVWGTSVRGDWCEGAEPSSENPIGTCACEGHLWIDAGCHQGYWCEDTTGTGCILVRL